MSIVFIRESRPSAAVSSLRSVQFIRASRFSVAQQGTSADGYAAAEFGRWAFARAL